MTLISPGIGNWSVKHGIATHLCLHLWYLLAYGPILYQTGSPLNRMQIYWCKRHTKPPVLVTQNRRSPCFKKWIPLAAA